MSTLFLLQYSCALVFFVLALLLVMSRFQQNTKSMHYNRSRSMLTLSMVILVLHYVLQMQFNLRAKSDDIGAVVNILFYIPVAYLVSCSIVELEGCKLAIQRLRWVGLFDCILTVAVFLGGWIYYDSLNMPMAQNVLHVLFVLSMIYFITQPILLMRSGRQRIVDNTGGDIAPYSLYARAAYLMLCMLSFSLVFAIVYRPMLFIVGPLVIVSLFFFVHSFIVLGYNMAPIEDILNDDSGELNETPVCSVDTIDNIPDYAEEKTQPDNSVIHPDADDESATYKNIDTLINRWIAEGGFRDTTVNMAKLAMQLCISRRDLSRYFDNSLHSTFRVWLSDLRFAEAQRLIRQHPEYSNDNISMGCGFSSRSQLYKIFSDRTGMTPREWSEQQGQHQN